MARIPDKEIEWLKHEISVQRLAEACLEKRGASTLLARQKAEDVFLSLLFEGWVARSPGWWASKIAGLRMRQPATGGAEARQMGVTPTCIFGIVQTHRLVRLRQIYLA